MKFTPRKNGERMVTKRIAVHLSESEVRWVALQLRCTLDIAAGTMLEQIARRMHRCGETWVVTDGCLELCEPTEEDFRDAAIYGG